MAFMSKIFYKSRDEPRKINVVDYSARRHKVSTVFGFLLILICLGFFGIAYWIDTSLPTGLQRSDEKTFPNAFIAQRAQEHLKHLTDLGPRVAGTERNEVDAVNFLMKEIDNIISNKSMPQFIEYNVTTASGDYLYRDRYVLYDNVVNVIVKIFSPYNSMASILINCHFDSVIGSPGGTDDGINCAAMLEVLRIMVSSERPTQNIIFLFNGAEEAGLLGAHGFITQHEWRKEVKVVINLEAMGVGGREILFQMGPKNAWLTDHYSQVSHPHAQVVGEEVFQSNLIPSDTDFRIFKDYGIIGLDFAFKENGYLYHTKYDNFENIELGSYQHIGDNLLSLVRTLSESAEIKTNVRDDTESVYYDIFGLFLIHYSAFVGTIMNGVTALFALVVYIIIILHAGRDNGIFVLLTWASLLCGWIVSLSFSVFVGFLLDLLNCTMSWYNKPWLLFGIYVFPSLAINCLSIVLFNRYKKQENISLGMKVQLQVYANIFIWTVFLIIGNSLSIRSMYILHICVLFATLSFIVIYIFRIHKTTKLWLIIYVVSSLLPSLFVMYLARITITIFIPIYGRMGSGQNPELFLSILTTGLSILIYSFYVPLISLIRKPYYIIIGLFVIFILTIIVVVSPLGFPYDGESTLPTPQRHEIWHSVRTYNHKDGTIEKSSGFLLHDFDRHSIRLVELQVEEFKNMVPFHKFCNSDKLLCGAPLPRNSIISSLDQITWIQARFPELPFPTILTQTDHTENNNIHEYSFSAKGPSQMGLLISPRIGAELEEWTFQANIISSLTSNDRTFYYLAITSGLTNPIINFSLTINSTLLHNPDNGIVDIYLTGKYVDENSVPKTPEFQKFIKNFPNWAYTTAAIADHQMYSF